MIPEIDRFADRVFKKVTKKVNKDEIISVNVTALFNPNLKIPEQHKL